MAQRKRAREIREIEDPQKKQVAFSKRRRTLFKHAQRLHDETSARVAVIVFSPGGRPYTFGVPSSADSVFDHYLLRLHHHHEEEEVERQAILVEEQEKRGWDWEAWLGEVDDDRCWSLDALATKKEELTEVKQMVNARLLSLNQPSPTSVFDDTVFDGGFKEGEEWVDEMIEELLSDPASSTSAPCCPPPAENNGVVLGTSLVPSTSVLDDAVVDAAAASKKEKSGSTT